MTKLILLLSMLLAQQLFAQGDKCIKGNCITGIGKMVYADGGTYEGSFIKGAKQGKGVFEDHDLVYTGEWKNNQYEGQGKLQRKDNAPGKFYEEYSGTFRSGINEGEGMYVYYLYADSNLIYKGNFKNGQYFGKGSLHVKNICTYYSDNWTDSKDFTSGKYVGDKTGLTLQGTYVQNSFEQPQQVQPANATNNQTNNQSPDRFKDIFQRPKDINSGYVIRHGGPIFHSAKIVDLTFGQMSEIVKYDMLSYYYSGFKRYFITPTLYSKKYPIPFGASFYYEIKNKGGETEVAGRQSMTNPDFVFDPPKDGIYTILVKYDFNGCIGCNRVDGLRLEFKLYSQDYDRKQ